jgi:predicted ATPase
LLEALEPSRPDAALDAIEEAERAKLVEPDRSGREVRYRFVHELVRQMLVEALSLPRRQRLHERVAGALERISGERQTSAIAHHLYQAGAVADPEKTIDYLMRAAGMATAGAAHQEALDSVDRALSLIEGERASANRGTESGARGGLA